MAQSKNDPRQTVSKFPSVCPKCNTGIKKGDDIVYWPKLKEAVHYECGQQDLKAFIETQQNAQDEEQSEAGYAES